MISNQGATVTICAVPLRMTYQIRRDLAMLRTPKALCARPGRGAQPDLYASGSSHEIHCAVAITEIAQLPLDVSRYRIDRRQGMRGGLKEHRWILSFVTSQVRPMNAVPDQVLQCLRELLRDCRRIGEEGVLVLLQPPQRIAQDEPGPRQI